MARARERRDATATGSLLNDDATGRGALEVAFVIHAVLDHNQNSKPPHMCRRLLRGA
jgi:hypothetical protein